MFQFKMVFYVTKTKDGLYHVQNYVSGIGGGKGQHHVHTKESFDKWKKNIDPKDIKISEGVCDCGLTKSGDVREYDGHEWHNDNFEE